MKRNYQLPTAALILVLCSFQSIAARAQSKKPIAQLGRNSLKEVIAAMTLEEKARLVVGMGYKLPGIPPPAKGERPKELNLGGIVLPPNDPEAFEVPEKVPGSAGRTHPIPRLGIPSITFSDGPAGVRIDPKRPNDPDTYYATAFPAATLLASSWDTALVRKVGMAFGNEVLEYGVDVIFGPALNIQRNPLGGRNFEYYSEDPLISGRIAAAMVNGIQANGVGASIKHFAASNQETNRMSIDEIISERALREIYLRAFSIAVSESKPLAVMSSYNKINGTYTSERRDLLTGILKNEWGFKGFVITDFFGGHDAVDQMNAGNDWLLPGNLDQSDAIVQAVKNGKLSMQQLDANVERLLNVIVKSPTFRGYKFSGKPDLKAHAKIARVAAAQSMVLLKNDGGALPLASLKNVAVFGNTSYDMIAGGRGSGDVNKAYTISLVQGLTNAGYKVEEGLSKNYTEYLADAKAKLPKSFGFFIPLPVITEMDVKNIIDQEAGNTDAAIVTIGRNEGEGADRKLENNYYLSDAEKTLIKSVETAFHAKGKKVIVVLNIGGIIEVASWRDSVDAILLAWQPGQEAGDAITDILSGKVNPSGKLATTFPVDYKDEPSASNFPGKEFALPKGETFNPVRGMPSEVTYTEGIYIGYRYFNSFNVKPAYAFGYGLSYTSFKLSDVKISSADFNGSISVSLNIENTGPVSGKEVAELYLSAPAGNIDKPNEELKAFGKTGLLAPGQSQTLTFTLYPRDLASFNTDKSAWIADAGEYKIKIGGSSDDTSQTLTFKLVKPIIVEKTHTALTPQVAITELKKI